MSKSTVAKIVPKGKPQPPKPQPEPIPTRMEHAEQTVVFVGYSFSEDKDLVRVAVAAEKTARALQLAIEGIRKESEHSVLGDEDFDLLNEMAAGTWLFGSARFKVARFHQGKHGQRRLELAKIWTRDKRDRLFGQGCQNCRGNRPAAGRGARGGRDGRVLL